MKKLWMFGCSFSDRTQVSHCYGELAAEKLNVNYEHQAAGCGSNDRIFRVLGNLIADEKVDSRDTIVVQYTGVDRTEFWSPIEQRGLLEHRASELAQRHGRITLRERYAAGGDVTRFKTGSYNWQVDTREASLHKQYEEFASFAPFNTERWRASHTMLQHSLLSTGARVVFLQPGCDGQPHYAPLEYEFTKSIIPEFRKDAYTNFSILNRAKGWTLGSDEYHLSLEGHRVLAGELAAHIKHREKEETNDQSWIHRSRQTWNALRRGNRS
jgi:hypothetical protein